MSPPGRLLDIGCSAGFFLYVAKTKGYDVFGVEPSISAINYCINNFDIKNVFHGQLEEAKYPDKFFKVITSFHSLEHVEDPMNHLKEICRILQDDGIIEIWTPNASHLFAIINKRKYLMLDRIEHLYYFRRNVLYNMLKSAGLEFYKLAGQNTLRPGMKIFARKCKN